jgi:hypothetical protein
MLRRTANDSDEVSGNARLLLSSPTEENTMEQMLEKKRFGRPREIADPARVTLVLSRVQEQGLTRIANRHNRSMSAIAREAIEQFLESAKEG